MKKVIGNETNRTKLGAIFNSICLPLFNLKLVRNFSDQFGISLT